MPIKKMVNPELGFGFTWDGDTRALYVIHDNGKPHEQIAANVDSEDKADVLVKMWCMGYRSRKREESRAPGVRHYHMFAETGKMGWGKK